MAGLTPFQFSSHKLQNANSKLGLTDPTQRSLLSDTYASALSWYEMWINPESVNIQDTFIQQEQHTAGAIVTHHFRKALGVLSVKGVAGWVAIQSDLEKLRSDALNTLRNPKKAHSNINKARKDVWGKVKDKDTYKDFAKEQNPFTQKGKSNSLNNSPRKFIERLRELAYEPTYYYDSKGREHYNSKFIKMYTKQYPSGVICEGYFKEFSVPETQDDMQTISYSFIFIIQDIQPVTLIQRVAGMFSPVGSVVGGGLGLI